MDDSKSPEIITVSGACCSPQYGEARSSAREGFAAGLSELGLTVEVRKVSLSAVLNSETELPPQQRKQMLGLFQRYNLRCTPTVLINGQVRFAGVPPSAQQLKEALQAVMQQEA